MQRIEVNLKSGERKVVDLTAGEIADAQARTAAETTGNAAVTRQIDAIENEHPFTHRYFREQLLAAVAAGVIAADHPVAVIAAAEDAQVQALRAQLT